MDGWTHFAMVVRCALLCLKTEGGKERRKERKIGDGTPHAIIVCEINFITKRTGKRSLGIWKASLYPKYNSTFPGFSSQGMKKSLESGNFDVRFPVLCGECHCHDCLFGLARGTFSKGAFMLHCLKKWKPCQISHEEGTMLG